MIDYKMPSEISKAITRIANVKDKSSPKFQTEIELFKTALRKNKHLQWMNHNYRVSLEIYQAMGEVLSEGIITQLDYIDYQALPKSLTILAPFIQKSKLTKLFLHLVCFSDEFAFFAKHLPVTLKDLTLHRIDDENRQLFLKELDHLKLNSLSILGLGYVREDGCSLTSVSATLLSQVIQKHPLNELTLHGVLNLSALQTLAPSIETSKISILKQYFITNEDDEKTCRLFTQLCAKSNITEIKIANTISTSAGFKMFVENLPKTRLKRLSLNETLLQSKRPQIEDIEHLANVLPDTELEYLSFSNNDLDLKSAKLLANKLMGSHLTQIPEDGIKKAAYAILAPALANNKEQHLIKHIEMKTTLDPYLPRVITDLIEEYLTQNLELMTKESTSVLKESVLPLLIKYQQLTEEPVQSKSKIKRRKIR